LEEEFGRGVVGWTNNLNLHNLKCTVVSMYYMMHIIKALYTLTQRVDKGRRLHTK